MLRSGDVILTEMQFIDSPTIKTRPALVLFEEYDNIVVAGITSNTSMEGIPLTRAEGVMKESVIKVNYVFTIAKIMVKKYLFSLSSAKKRKVYDQLVEKLRFLKE